MEMEAVERIEIEGENPDGFQEDIVKNEYIYKKCIFLQRNYITYTIFCILITSRMYKFVGDKARCAQRSVFSL